MKKTITTLYILLLTGLTFACTHTLRITDTYGDGWNGGIVKVRVNGVDVLTNVGTTFTTGFGPLNFTFSANAGDAISIIETAAGSFSTEMRCEVLDGAGISMGTPFDPISTGTNFVGTCPAPMTVVSCAVTQEATGSIPNCGSNQKVVKLTINTVGGIPLTVTQIQTNANGTAAVSAFSTSKIYFTGSANSFSATTLLGSAAVSASTYSINGSVNLVTGANYFWLVYDLNNTGIVGTTVDAIISQFTASAVNYTSVSSPAITTTNPAGNGTISTCPFPGGVSSGLQTWLRADMGTSGVASMTAWSNQASGGTATNLNGNPALNIASTSYNYNPYVDFAAPVATLDGGVAASRQCILLNGYSGILGIDYKSVHFAFQLNDLTRLNTHCGTVQGVTVSAPANGTWHGDANGATASILLEAYDITDFGTSSAASTWQRNGGNIASNSNHSSTKHILSAVCQTTGSTTLNAFLGGQNDQTPASSFAGNTRDWKGPAAEIIGYTTQLTTIERLKIDSYLAVKYGITLSSNYLSTGGGTIYTNAAPYSSNIIGIGRDDVEMLSQKQSHYDNDDVRIYLSSIAASNSVNAGTFSSNISYIVMGDNNGAHCTNAVALAEMPTGLTNCALYSRMEKEWKVTRTNMSQNYNMDVKIAACGAPTTVNTADLRLLVDDDGNFANGGTQCYYNGDGTGIVISYSNPTITLSNISTTHIPNNATKFITIASISGATPLPIELLDFNAELSKNGRTVDVKWVTQSEQKVDYFEVQKLSADNEWLPMAQVDAAGNSTTIQKYATVDLTPRMGMNFYRLQEVTDDGEFSYSTVRMVALEPGNELLVYPNPGNESVVLWSDGITPESIEIFDESGRKVTLSFNTISKNEIQLNTAGLANGLYLVRLKSNELQHSKLVIQH